MLLVREIETTILVCLYKPNISQAQIKWHSNISQAQIKTNSNDATIYSKGIKTTIKLQSAWGHHIMSSCFEFKRTIDDEIKKKHVIYM